MTAVLVALCAGFGLLVGSFLNVVVWRVPRGESVVRPRSHCPGCGHEIRSRDNVPVVSWLLLRGRCRDCDAAISPRYPAVELLTGGLFGGMAARLGADPALPAYLYLAGLCVALALVDLETHRLPDVLTLPAYVVGPVLLGAAALGEGEPGRLVRALIGLAALYAVYFLLALAYPAGMGFGDVKLAGVLGLFLAYLGWGSWLVGWLGGFLLGGLFGVVLLATGRAGRKTKIPFGPFMIAGALLAVFAGEPIADVWLSSRGL